MARGSYIPLNIVCVRRDNVALDYRSELERGIIVIAETQKRMSPCIAIEQLTADYVARHSIDVVISNGLPVSSYAMLRQEGIVSVTLDSVDTYEGRADIVIDHKADCSQGAFTGSQYAFDNSDFKNNFYAIIHLVELLEHDSGFWGMTMGRVTCGFLSSTIIKKIKKIAVDNHIQFLQYLCSSHNQIGITIAESNNFHFVDTRLTYEKKLPCDEQLSFSNDPSYELNTADDKDILSLRKAARDLFPDSRYFLDPNFDKETARLFHENWVENAVHGIYDDVCYCLRKDGALVGFCTVKYMSKTSAQFGIGGILNEYRNQGAGARMFINAIQLLHEKGFEALYVATQGKNYTSQRLFQNAGFRTHAVDYWLHHWAGYSNSKVTI